MSLDKLYQKVKNVHYPINDRDEMVSVLGDLFIDFESSKYDARTIAMAIEHYPIHTPADVIGFFIEGTQEYNDEAAVELNEALDHEFKA